MRNTRDCIVESQQVISAKIAETFDELVAKMVLEEGKEVCAERADSGACGTPNRQSSVSCARHPSQTLDVYCCKCKETVCRDCILFDKKNMPATQSTNLEMSQKSIVKGLKNY